MDTLPVFIHHKGHWDQSMNYVNFEVNGILIPKDCNFNNLTDILSKQLKFKNEETTMDIKYKVKSGYPPLKIENDASLSFYLELKKTESDFTKYPLCVTLVDNAIQNNFFASTSRTTSLAASEQHSTNVDTSDTTLDFIEYANVMSKKIVGESKTKKQDEEESNNAELCVITNTRHPNIEVGQVYKDKQTLIIVLSFYAISNHFQYKVKKSCKREYVVLCLDEKCKWYLRASRNGQTEMFVIRKYYSIHTCPPEMRLSDQRQATINVVGECIKSKYLNVQTVYTPADIVRDMKNDYGITLNYSKAWRSKEKVLQKMRGNSEESYQLLPSYLHMVNKSNPGSVIDLQTKNDNTFLFVFMALDASIKGWKYCRPVMVVDVTFLKATYGVTLLSASTQDAAGNIFPLAFCVVDSENDASWEWFFTKLREAFGIREGMCIISDRYESIQTAAKKVYPEVTHGVCIFHLLNNLKTNFKKNTKKIKDSFFGAAKSYTIDQFEYHMSELDKVDKRLRPYLSSIGYDRWSRVHSTNNRYSTMTSNIAEPLNAANKAARDLPITTLLEYLRALVQEWTWTNRNIAKSTFTKLAKRPEAMLNENSIHSLKLKVKPLNEELFTVYENENSNTVNLKKRTCTCNKFQMDEIPCEHAIAILKEIHQDPYDYCSEYYTKETMIATYEATVYPIGNQNTWNIPDEIKDIKVLPSEGKVKAGRPKKRRFEAAWETKTQNKCGRCGQSGHNRKTCRNLPKKK